MSEVNPYQSPVPEVEDDDKDVSYGDIGNALLTTLLSVSSLVAGAMGVATGSWPLALVGLLLMGYGCFGIMCCSVLAHHSVRRNRL